MTTTGQVLKAALQEILVQGSEAPLEADEYQDAIFALNNYMTALDANGVHLGYTVVDSLADEITVPAGAIQGIISNLAILLATQFNSTVSPSLSAKAQMGLNAMRKLGITIAPMSYPGTLPIGSGNEGYWGGYCRGGHFYPDPVDTALTETGNNIALETNT